MAATPPGPSDIFECVVFGLADGQSILNVFHWRAQAAAGSGVVMMPDIVAGLRDAWRAGVLPSLNASYTVSLYQVTRIEGKTRISAGPPAQYKLKYDLRATLPGAGAPDTGGSAGDPLPTFNAMGMLKRTNLAGRHGRGAIRFGPITETEIDSNTVDPVFSGAFKTAAQEALVPYDVFTAGDELEFGMVLFRKTEYLASDIPVETPELYFVDVTALEVRPFASSQTSRKRKRVGGA